jgi:hypothetical protein
MVISDYNAKFLDKAGTDHLIDELKAYADNVATGDIDLSSYVTEEELQEKLDALNIDIDLSSYATKEELQQSISNIEIPTGELSDYAKKEHTHTMADIMDYSAPDLTDYAKKEDIPTVVDGETPYIGNNGNWYIGDTDTGVKAQGDKGDKGDDGVVIFEGLTEEQKLSLKGDKGDKGDIGEQGIQGIQGEKGEDGRTPVRGTDYWTDEDITTIHSYIDSQLGVVENGTY